MSQSHARDRPACAAGELHPHRKPSSTAGEEATELWRAEGRGAALPRHAGGGAHREGELHPHGKPSSTAEEEAAELCCAPGRRLRSSSTPRAGELRR
jgi:hypothetical protein